MRREKGVGMHAVLFGAKRVYWGTIRFGKEVLAEVGLTPARFDLMWAIREETNRGYLVTQSWVRKALGVCPTVVARMVFALEKLGLVTRRRLRLGDRRQIELRLTMEGHRRIKKIERYKMKTGVLARCIDKLFLTMEKTKFNRLLELHSVLPALERWGRNLGDTSTLRYTWHKRHPDD